MSSSNAHQPPVRRRTVLGAGAALGAALAAGGTRPLAARADTRSHPTAAPVPAARATELWYPAAAPENAILAQGLPLGNGRLGALTTGGAAEDVLLATDGSLWTGNANAALQSDGQFPYDADHFGTLAPIAALRLALPDHTDPAGYRRALDLSNGRATVTYRTGRTDHRREAYASHPDDVLVLHLTADGPDRLTGTLDLEGRHAETTAAAGPDTALLTGTLANGLRYAAAATAADPTGTGTVALHGATLAFTGCAELLVVLAAGTDYAPDPAAGYRNPGLDVRAAVLDHARTAAAAGPAALLGRHLGDYRPLAERMTVDLGDSTREQRALDTWSRLKARTADHPDPELEAAYLQFGRHLLISSSRDRLPAGLQGLWLDRNDPAWMADYHTDINVQMNYWAGERTGLADCFGPLLDYVEHQVPVWTDTTRALFNDPRNGFRNSTGKIAGWTTAISTNIHGGLGWWWHPAGNAWLCNQLWQHYEFTGDRDVLTRIHPLLKGACEFWQARLITATVDGGDVLVDDADWSPEQGPTDAKGITYAQELVHELFGHFADSAELLARDADFAAEVADLRNRLYLPRISPATGRLEEWMTPDDLGETTHRHLSPLVGLFPGDRIRHDTAPADLVAAAEVLLLSRGFESFGWGLAWRAACWARLRNADNAYRLIGSVLTPADGAANGTAPNFFDMYDLGSSATFQIDANFGAPAAMVEMLVYSRPGVVEVLPALPDAWAKRGSLTGAGARGGLTVDVSWSDGKATKIVLHNTGTAPSATEVRAGAWQRTVTIPAGTTATLTP